MSIGQAQDYAHPELLADTSWLAEHLSDPDLRIVDMGVHEGYLRAHIPGSVHPGPERSNYIKDPADPVHVMPPDAFAELMARLGIGDDTLVVAYDADGGYTAARLWWVLNHYGNTNCKVLNGGWNKWLAEGRPVSMAIPTYPRSAFNPRATKGRLCKLEHAKGHIGKSDVALIDVRSDGEWDGTETRGNKRSGHMPGAVHLEWHNYVTDDDLKTLKPAHELRALFEKSGVTHEKLAVTY